MYYSKYRAKKVEYNGMTFDSKKECKRYKELELLEANGEIRNLRRQVKYELIPKQKLIKPITRKGRTYKTERAAYYTADFVYQEKENGKWVDVVEDCKGMRLDTYKLKYKLMLLKGIQIRES